MTQPQAYRSRKTQRVCLAITPIISVCSNFRAAPETTLIRQRIDDTEMNDAINHSPSSLPSTQPTFSPKDSCPILSQQTAAWFDTLAGHDHFSQMLRRMEGSQNLPALQFDLSLMDPLPSESIMKHFLKGMSVPLELTKLIDLLTHCSFPSPFE